MYYSTIKQEKNVGEGSYRELIREEKDALCGCQTNFFRWFLFSEITHEHTWYWHVMRNGKKVWGAAKVSDSWGVQKKVLPSININWSQIGNLEKFLFCVRKTLWSLMLVLTMGLIWGEAKISCCPVKVLIPILLSHCLHEGGQITHCSSVKCCLFPVSLKHISKHGATSTDPWLWKRSRQASDCFRSMYFQVSVELRNCFCSCLFF